MGCLVALFALISPRLALFVLWIFSDVLERAYDDWIVPVLGFFLLPWTTLAYAAFWSWGSNGVGGLRVVLRDPRLPHRPGPPTPTDSAHAGRHRMRRVTLSRNYTLSLSRTCQCFCKHCAFATHRAHIHDPDEVERRLEEATRRNAKELLVLTGERPEVNPEVAERLRSWGHEDFHVLCRLGL